MAKSRSLAWITVALTAALLTWLVVADPQVPELGQFVFWASLLFVAEALPVSLGFETRVTMSFPILLAVAILFPPLPGMIIAGFGEFDRRELRREIPLWRALFNRCQLMLAVAASSAIVGLADRSDPFTFPTGALAIGGAALVFVIANLGLVGLMVHFYVGLPYPETFRSLLPTPTSGFWLSQAVLAGLGAATAAVYDRIGVFVAVFLIPLLFARLSLLGARAQQELSERIQKQQQALLEATERVFAERERERHRIAEQIHDTSLQLLAAASYGCGNAAEFVKAGRFELAEEVLRGARDAIDGAMKALRDSIVDLRRSTVESGGLVESIEHFCEQLALLWGTEVRIEGAITVEPPAPVALAAFQILQEGLTNALKHAQSNVVVVRIGEDDGMVQIAVEDDGTGFDPAEEVGSEHVGMRLMKERAARVGGHIEFKTAPGGGTTLRAILPGGVSG